MHECPVGTTAFEVNFAHVIPFGKHPDDLVLVNHDQAADASLGHDLQGIVDRCIRRDAVDFTAFQF